MSIFTPFRPAASAASGCRGGSADWPGRMGAGDQVQSESPSFPDCPPCSQSILQESAGTEGKADNRGQSGVAEEPPPASVDAATSLGIGSNIGSVVGCRSLMPRPAGKTKINHAYYVVAVLQTILNKGFLNIILNIFKKSYIVC
jgi:hypothetical protein